MEAFPVINSFSNETTQTDVSKISEEALPTSRTYEPLLAISFLYVALLVSYTSKRFNSFRKHHFTLVTIHTISNLLELVQFYTLPSRYSTSGSLPVPIESVLLCFLQVYTSFALVRKLKRGNPAIVRTTYQAAAVLRAGIIIPAYILQSRTLYHDSVVIIHAFVYARLIIWLFSIGQYFPSVEISELDSLNGETDKAIAKELYEMSGANKTLVTSQQAYTAGIYGSALIVVGHQEDEFMRKFGIMIFLGIMGILMRMEQWVGDSLVDYLQGKRILSLKQMLCWKLYEIGFCRMTVLTKVDNTIGIKNKQAAPSAVPSHSKPKNLRCRRTALSKTIDIFL